MNRPTPIVPAPRCEAGRSKGEFASPIQAYLAQVHERYAGLGDGNVARYIPELAKADPTWFGIAICTTDGHVYEVGDTRQAFTIQSISKPFTYGMALEDRGQEALLQKIGVEPTGDAFNSISLAPGTGRPLNPMINAGAITATSQIAGSSWADRLERILAVFSLYAGRSLDVDSSVYESERSTGHRNRAIGHMLRNFDVLEDDPEPALALYFKQCSISVDCRDLSVMAATLANTGLNPITGERAIRGELVDSLLSVMTTCGMYDFAGEWVYSIGLPAKSGVAGGILAVLPGQLGIGVFSPPLDDRGNSVRGIAVCRDLSRDLDLHFLRVPRGLRAAIRAEYGLRELNSRRVRSDREREVLGRVGDRVRVYELQGDTAFPAIEAVVRGVVAQVDRVDFFVVDFRRVTRLDPSSARLLLDLWLALEQRDGALLLASVGQQARLVRFLEEQLAVRGPGTRLLVFPDVDRALEWCESRLLASAAGSSDRPDTIELAEHAVCLGLGAGDLAALAELTERCVYRRGAQIIRRGEPADHLYLLMRGEVSVTVDLPDGQLRRLSTLAAGMAFGELAVLDRAARTADVRADTEVECLSLSADSFERLGTTHPRIKATLLGNLLRNASRMVSRLNHELSSMVG